MSDPIVRKLEKAIRTLQRQRWEHVAALDAIDAMFTRLGIPIPSGGGTGRPRRGRPPGSGKAKQVGRPKATGKRRRKRGSFKTTGPVSIVAFVTAGGKGGRTTREINAHWKGEGRTGDAYVALGNLVKARTLKRQNITGKRGSRYTAA